jgi:hypothetical protein
LPAGEVATMKNAGNAEHGFPYFPPSMLEEYQRPLTADERAHFQRQLEGKRRALEQLPAQVQLPCVSGFCGLVGLMVEFELNQRGPKASFWLVSISLGALATSMLLLDEARKSRSNTQAAGERLQRILKENNVYVFRVASSAVAAIQEDEWDDYLFQVEPGTLFYLDSVDYYGTAGFPNSDFELIGYRASEWGATLRLSGDPLTPVTRFTPDEDRRLRALGKLPEPDALFPGNLDELRRYAATA